MMAEWQAAISNWSSVEMRNIDDFDKHAASCFRILYGSFPKPTYLEPLRLVRADWSPSREDVPSDEEAAECEKAADCLMWLHKHGYFDATPVFGPGFFAGGTYTKRT